MTATIYVRVSDEAKHWLEQQHKASGLPMAKIIDMILSDAVRRDVTVRILIAEPDAQP